VPKRFRRHRRLDEGHVTRWTEAEHNLRGWPIPHPGPRDLSCVDEYRDKAQSPTLEVAVAPTNGLRQAVITFVAFVSIAVVFGAFAAAFGWVTKSQTASNVMVVVGLVVIGVLVGWGLWVKRKHRGR
jgi:hypothetical protein